MKAIVNARAIIDGFVLDNAVILIEGERIVSIGTCNDFTIPTDAEIIDAKGLFVGPGLVDIHVHGGDKYMFDAEPEKAAEHFLSHGETTILATLYYNLSKDELVESIKRVKNAMSYGAGGAIKGIYMEGPYMNPKYGASPEKNKWRGEIKEENYKEIVDVAAEHAKVWAVAPEREGIEPFLKYVKSVNPSAIISVGHSEATPAQVRSLKGYGITLQTHCMNATGRREVADGTRSCGPDEACLMDKNMFAEVICDSQGIHVAPDMLEFILTIKGLDKVVLISDSFVSAEPTPEEFAHITDLSFDANGGLSGSKLTLDVACKNFMKHTGCGIIEAFIVASRNPARAIGMFDEIGSIAEGKRADLIFVDEEFNLKNIILNGELQKGF